MNEHPLNIEDCEMTKTALAPLAILGILAGLAGTVGTGAFAYNQIRRAWRGPEYENHIKVYPVYGLPQNQGLSGGFPSFLANSGYSVPGALAGAALGGLLGKSWGSAALGGLAGAGLGYFAGRMGQQGMGTTGNVGR